MNIDAELVLRILVGTALGSTIGYEREIHGRPAGLRTHMMVALASATFMVVSTHLAYYQDWSKDDLTHVDGSRIGAAVVSGVGFLAGGAILRTGLTIEGLASAAGLWLVAAIGLCAGAGMYVVSVVATGIGVGTLTVMVRLEGKGDRVPRRLVLTLSAAALPIDALVAKLGEKDLPATIEGWNLENDLRELTLRLRLPRANGHAKLVAALEAEPGIVRMQLEAPM